MAAAQDQYRFEDPSLPLEERIDDLLARLTVFEKIGQLVHDAPAISRLGIPAYNWWNEGLHGLARGGLATVFPQAIGMAASFDASLMKRVASVIADEARAKHHEFARRGDRGIYQGLTLWSPNINLLRDPRWGRGQETYGECPYLTARMGVAFVQGLQGDDPHYLKVVATPKHFAAHSGPEIGRHHFDAHVSPRDLHESYLPAFKACVREARAASVMAAYNRLNGDPCCAHDMLLKQVLHGTWDFEGYVVSDCWALADFHAHHKVTRNVAESAALALRAGCDLNCGDSYGSLPQALEQGLVWEEEIDAALRRLLRARFRLGQFDPPDQVPYAAISYEVVASEPHRRLALEMARKSIVLLRNDAALLPLERPLRSVAVIGPTAAREDVLLGNYHGTPLRAVTILAGLHQAWAPEARLWYAEGCTLLDREPVSWLGGSGALLTEALATAARAEVVILCLGLTPQMEGEEGDVLDGTGSGDRAGLELPASQQRLAAALQSLDVPVVLVLTGGGPIALTGALAELPAVLMVWYPGERGGEAVADVLRGRTNPAGRLPATFVSSTDQLPPFDDYRMAGRTYRFLTGDPLYRFGFGLSYTRFTYRNLRLSRTEIGPADRLEISLEVINSGARAGDEVVQLYVTDLEATVPVPRLHLEGFARIHLEPGEACPVTFTLHPAQLAAYADDGSAFLEAGEFVLWVGGGQPGDHLPGLEARFRVREEGAR